MTPAREAILELRDVSKTYVIGDIQVRALAQVSLTVERGQFVAIMGPSGSGKSTLLHVLGWLDRPDAGAYLFQGRDVARLGEEELAHLRNQEAGFIFQQFHLLPRLTAEDNVALPMIYSGKGIHPDLARRHLHEVGLDQRRAHKPNELSGGQQQRVAIARSLVNDPDIIFADEPTGNLDSKSEAEILAILKDLHARGKTIIMVTHERDIAEQAERILTMRDGVIIGDERLRKGTPHRSRTEAPALSEGPADGARTALLGKIGQNIRQGFQALFSNKMRSLLSVLGILIGVASVIAMLALGQGAEQSIRERMSALGTNLLNIRPGSFHRHGAAGEAGAVSRFTLQDSDALVDLPYVKYVSPTVSGRVQAVNGNRNWNTYLQGVGESYPAMKDAEPVAGRFFTHAELQRRAKVVLLGKTVARELFGEEDPVGQVIKLNRIQFGVLGVLPEKGDGPRGDQDDTVVVPVTTAMYRMLGKTYLDQIEVEVDQLSHMDAAIDEISNELNRRQRLTPEEAENAYTIRNMAEIQEALQGMTKTMTMLLGFIAAISLLVGGIGIMNIMLVSVTERTREIGLRKALGARRRDILQQFLIESMVMTFFGGAVGILFGAGAAGLLSLIAGWATQVSAASVLMATAFSVAIGLIFGLWPAQKAARLDPITALRYE